MYRKCVPVLKDVISQDVTLDKDEKKRNVRIIEDFIKDELLRRCKEIDELFKVLYQNIYYTGSFYDGLRVGSSTEFDLNIVLDIKINEADLEYEDYEDRDAGYIGINTKRPLRDIFQNPNHPLYGLKDKFEKTFFNGFSLSPEKTRNWFHSVIDRAIKELRPSLFRIEYLRIRQSGPARTLLIRLPENREIDVDLVPVFRFSNTFLRNYNGIDHHSLNWGFDFFIIPKKTPARIRNSDMWRLDFHDDEKIILKSKGCAKPVIKLLKRFRDANQDKSDIKKISSYVLKTVVMWMIRHDPVNPWNEVDMGSYFLEALKNLASYLEKKHVPYYFNPKCNILWKLNDNLYGNISNWLKREIRGLENEELSVWRDKFSLVNKPQEEGISEKEGGGSCNVL